MKLSWAVVQAIGRLELESGTWLVQEGPASEGWVDTQVLFSLQGVSFSSMLKAQPQRFVWRKDRTLGFLVCKVKIPESSELGLKVRV